MADVAPITVSEAVKKLVARSQRGGDRLNTAVLELAAALFCVTEHRNGPKKVPSPFPDSVDGVLSEWTESCAELLAAIAEPLSHDPRRLNRIEASPGSTALIVAAERLTNQTRSSSESLGNLARELKANSAELVRQAGEVGTLSLASQRERLRLAEDLRKIESLNSELKSLSTERGPAVERIRLLQERRQLAQATIKDQRSFEQQVRDAESAATLAKASVEELNSELHELRQKLAILQAEQAVLPDRIKKTQELIQQLSQSPNRKLFEGIQKIWKQLPLDQIDGGS